MSAYFESLDRHLRSADAPPKLRRAVRLEAPLPRLRPAGIPPEYAALRDRLVVAGKGRRLSVLAFAACEGGEGATWVAREFAEALATMGLGVLLVDAELRTQGLTRALRPEGLGLTAAVAAAATPTARPWGAGRLAIVPAPETPPNSERFFGSAEFAAWIDAQRAVFDYVLFDAPPVSRAADSMALSRLCDGIVVVAEAAHTRRAALARAHTQLQLSGVNVVGLVLNRIHDPVPEAFRRRLGLGS
jgi:capsular exopolysaccharide synthesis family protein